MSKRSNLVAIVVVGFMLLLPLSLALPSQLAGARKQSDGQVPTKQSNSQKLKCSSDAICLAKAIDVLSEKFGLLYRLW
jgi:hypothetical protein